MSEPTSPKASTPIVETVKPLDRLLTLLAREIVESLPESNRLSDDDATESK